MPRHFIRHPEAGSLAPLGIGLALLSLATILVILTAGSLYLSERRLTSAAESTALATLALSDRGTALLASAQDFLAKHPLDGLSQVRIDSVSKLDGKTVRVRLCSRVLPLIPNYMFSEVGIVCAEGLARKGR